FIQGEDLDRDTARKMLGLPGDERLILVQLGGTRAGEELVYEAAAQALKHGLTPVVATGPRARPRIPQGAYTIGYNPLLPKMLNAFDCAYTLAGLSTIASLAAAGVPAALKPLPGHFEQESNAVKAPRTWPGLFYSGSRPWEWLKDRCGSKHPVESLHRHPVNVARILSEAVNPPW
ncbi:MAG: hypothetical protein GSR86_01555, partial [Desulfurococcales archaeon]|nr:hypothetical protein [Desulfurococcales archaeon]